MTLGGRVDLGLATASKEHVAAAGRRASRVSSTRTVERALALLSEVCSGEAVSLTDVRPAHRPAASTALRLLRTLEAAGFVSRDDERHLPCRAAMIQLGATAVGRHELARLAAPRARPDRRRRTSESAYLSIRGVDETAVYIAAVEGTHAVRHSELGRAGRADGGLAVGQVLSGRRRRRVGYVAGRDRLEPDVTAIVAPVRYPGGIAGALSVLGPTYRIDRDHHARYGRIVADEAAGLSDQLGCVHDPATGQETTS